MNFNLQAVMAKQRLHSLGLKRCVYLTDAGPVEYKLVYIHQGRIQGGVMGVKRPAFRNHIRKAKMRL